MAPQLPTRQLGKNGPQVTALGFGLMGLSAFYGKPESDEARFNVLDAAYERGETNWDSADAYERPPNPFNLHLEPRSFANAGPLDTRTTKNS